MVKNSLISEKSVFSRQMCEINRSCIHTPCTAALYYIVRYTLRSYIYIFGFPFCYYNEKKIMVHDDLSIAKLTISITHGVSL